MLLEYKDRERRRRKRTVGMPVPFFSVVLNSDGSSFVFHFTGPSSWKENGACGRTSAFSFLLILIRRILMTQIDIDMIIKELLLTSLENKIAMELEKHYRQPIMLRSIDDIIRNADLEGTPV